MYHDSSHNPTTFSVTPKTIIFIAVFIDVTEDVAAISNLRPGTPLVEKKP